MGEMGDMLAIDHIFYSVVNKLPEEILDNLHTDAQNDLLAKLINYFETSDLDPSIGEAVVNSVTDKLDDLTKKKLGSVKNKFLGEVRDNDFVQRAKNLSLSKSLKNATNQLIGTATNIVEGVVERAVLGNLYTFSLTRLADQALSLAEGNIWSAGRNINEYSQDAKQRNQGGVQSIENPGTLYEGQGESIGDLDTDETRSAKTKYINHSLGNMFQSSTIANNI